MRRRSCAYHAESNEEFIKIAIESQNQENYFYERNQSRSPKSVGRTNRDIESPVQTYIEDFSFSHRDIDFEENEEFLSGDRRENSPSIYTIDMFDDSAVNFDMEPEKTVKETKINAMLLGALNVGKHALINSQFPDLSDADATPLKNKLDLIIRKTTTPTTETSIQFWIRELVADDNDSYERLLELYYRRCSIYVFVYDMTSRESFDKIESEIVKVKKCIGESNFLGLLIATNSDRADERMVSYEEGVALKVKHSLQHFCETNVFIERETQQFLKKLQSLASASDEE